MKKLLMVLAILFIMSGCGEKANMMSCRSTTTANGVTTDTTYDIDYVDDEVKYVTITYDYNQDMSEADDNNANDDVDGVNSDTDGLEEDNDSSRNADTDAEDVVDGVVGEAIDDAVDGVRETILDIAGIKNRYENQLSTYDNMEGFSYDVDVDSNTQYKVIYKIDMSKISDSDLATFNIGRNVSDIRDNYEGLGYSCK